MADKQVAKTSNKSILKNMAVLVRGSVIGKVVGVLSIPIITRIYGPESLGALAVFVAIAALLIPLGSLRYAVAIPLPRHDVLAINLVAVSFGFLISLTLLSGLILAFAAEPVMNLLSMPSLIPYWWLLPIAIFGAGFYEILNSWATREKAFNSISKTIVWQSVSGAITKIILGLIDLKPLGLLIGHIVTQSAGILTLAKLLQAKLKRYQHKITKKRIVFLIKRFSDYPKYRLPSQFLMVFSMQAPLLFSAWLYGAEITGQLGLAFMAIALPITLFGQTTGQAYYAEISRIGRRQPEKILAITRNITLKLFFVSFLPFLILLFFGPWIFKLVFGTEWEQAGLFASLLAVYLSMQFISAPIVNALSVFEKQGMFLMINIRRAIFIVVIFGSSYWLEMGAEKTLLFFSLALSMHYLLVTYYIFKVIKQNVY